jgi:Rrf2 family iron-sulfur cluster assembly transcriptional regulator
MNTSNKSRVALDALVILQKKQNRGAISLVSIAQELNVSVSYLELIFRTLREAGLVAASRGPGGGYRLNTPADQITPQGVCLLFESELAEPTEAPASSPESAPVLALAHRMKSVKQNFLSQITLKSLASQGAMI